MRPYKNCLNMGTPKKSYRCSLVGEVSKDEIV